MRPQSAHAGEVVLELGELDLELSGRAVGVVGEDVEDDRRPVDDRHAEGALEVALLPRCQLVVAGDEVGTDPLDLGLQLVELATPEVAIRVGLGPLLDHPAFGCDAGGAEQFAELVELGVLTGSASDDADRDCTLTRPRVANPAAVAVGSR